MEVSARNALKGVGKEVYTVIKVSDVMIAVD